jgi:hypothetical protein
MNRHGASQTNQGAEITPLLAGGILQRKCDCGQHTIAGGKCDECGQIQLSLQRATRNSQLGSRGSQLETGNSAGVPSIVHQVLRSSGRPLDSATRAFFEPRFGYDFSRVRVHSDNHAAESAQAVNALAYTVGRNVVFAAGQYAPGSTGGKGLLAHELAHVVQQNDNLARKERLTIGSEHDPAEREADAVAVAILNDQPASVSAPHTNSVVQRQVPTATTYGVTPTSSHIPPAAPGLSTVKVWLNTFIPMATAGPYAGDNRGFSANIHASHRTHQEIEFETATLHKTIDWKHIGTSHVMVPSSLLPPGTIPPIFRPASISVASATASTNTLTNGPLRASGGEVLVHFEVDSSNPLAPGAPAINFEGDFHLDTTRRTCSLQGSHDGFPAYEAYVTANGGSGTFVYGYDPRTAGEGPSALFPPMDKSASTGPVSF